MWMMIEIYTVSDIQQNAENTHSCGGTSCVELGSLLSADMCTTVRYFSLSLTSSLDETVISVL